MIFHDRKFLLPPDLYDTSKRSRRVTDQLKVRFKLSEGDVLKIMFNVVPGDAVTWTRKTGIWFCRNALASFDALSITLFVSYGWVGIAVIPFCRSITTKQVLFLSMLTLNLHASSLAVGLRGGFTVFVSHLTVSVLDRFLTLWILRGMTERGIAHPHFLE
jgi:hypothetical protein